MGKPWGPGGRGNGMEGGGGHTSIVCDWCMVFIAFMAPCLLEYVTNAQPKKYKNQL